MTATRTTEAEAGSEFRAGDRVRAIGAHGFKGTVKAIDPEAGQAWVR